MNRSALHAKGITKRFAGVTALKNVSFELVQGEIHAICGENGAGKSTLIKLLCGIHPFGSFDGELEVEGTAAHFYTVADSSRAGIAVICQELALVEGMSVAENIYLGAEPCRFGFIDWARIHENARELLDKFQVSIDPMHSIAGLGVGEKQLVEIVKALGKRSRILILDEPTAALAEHEVRTLLSILRDLRRRGISCIYISHKLEEVFSIADRVTVLRDGSTVATLRCAQTDKQEIIRHMVGRELGDLFPRRASASHASSPKAPALQIEDLSVEAPRTGKLRLHRISLSLQAGEVLGIGGLMGAGRTELLMHLCGAWGVRRGGMVKLVGEALEPSPPAEVLRRGLALVSEDRRRYGLVLEQTIGFNLSLSSLKRLARLGFIDRGAEFVQNDRAFRALRIKAPALDATAGKLSGGNQQKVVLGKALMTNPKVILLDEPTRGIDVGAKLEIYEIINRLTDEGKAVILVSSELPELLGMSDRIIMLHEGRIGGEFTRAEATQEKLLHAAMGPARPEPV